MDALLYLDNGATTKVDRRVADAALAAMTESWGNPSSAHRLGIEAARRVTAAREQVARAIGADPSEVTFTSGGTEANAIGFYGAAHAARQRQLVITGFEHPSVNDAAKRLAEDGWSLTLVAPEKTGVISVDKFAAAISAETAVAAILWVQNEIGSVQPVKELAQAVKARAPRCHVHLDAVQAVGKLPVDVASLAIDSLALSGHKLHAPKGVGALWLRKNARVRPRTFGGGQERGLRPGTENVPGIVALGLAVELAEAARREAAPRLAAQRDRLWDGIVARRPNAIRHVAAAHAAPHILSVGFPGAPAEPLLHALEARGVLVSAGSACHAKDKKPSQTLRAIGVADDVGTLRFSLCRDTTDEEITRAIDAVDGALKDLSR